MRALVFAFLMTAALAATQGQQTFTGAVTDSMCAQADHSEMHMGPTDGECTVACIFAHDARYVLYDGNETYRLSDQQAAEEFAGQRVTVTGTLDDETRTIQMESIATAE